MNTLKIAIVGAGGMTKKRHAPALVRLQTEGLCEIVGVYDINPQAAQDLSKSYSIPLISQLQELIESDEIDAVFVFANPEAHYSIGLSVLRSGKHLFVEKPPAPSASQLHEMVQCAEGKNLVAAVGFNRRFQQSIQTIRNYLPQELITSGEAIFHKASGNESPQFGLETWLPINGIHAIDTLCMVMGRYPTALYSTVHGDTSDTRTKFSAVIEWGSERAAIFSSNNAAGTRQERYAFFGDGVTLVAESGEVTISRGGELVETSHTDADSKGGIYEEFLEFLSAIQEKRVPLHSLESALPTLRLVELIESGFRGALDWGEFRFPKKDEKESEQTRTEVTPRATKPSVTIDLPIVLVLNPNGVGPFLKLLDGLCEVAYEDDLTRFSSEELQRVSALLTGGKGATAPTAEMFDMLPNLSLLGVTGASVVRWGGEEALARNIAVINTSESYAEAVAEFVLMQAINGIRRASRYHDVMRSGGWGYHVTTKKERIFSYIKKLARLPGLRQMKDRLRKTIVVATSTKKTPPHARLLKGKKVAFFGFGEITKKCLPYFKIFDCALLVYSEHLDPKEAEILGVKQATLREALSADVVVMNRGLSSRTARSFGQKEINALRPGAVFINSGRAGLVDNAALKRRLRDGDIFACVDVFDEEPLRENDEFRQLQNVFLTPHIAGSIYHIDELDQIANEQLVHNVVRYLKDGSHDSTIDESRLKNMT